MTPPCLLFGATSITGYNLAIQFPDQTKPYIPVKTKIPPKIKDKAKRLKLESTDWIKSQLDQFQPTTLIYAHAVCDVSKCEDNPDWAYAVNVEHVERMLSVIPDDLRLVYVSSDHVFGEDGTYDESSQTCPVSVYGETRVEAEKRITTHANSLIVRSGLSIGESPHGKTGHRDWLRYRMRKNLPVTIVEDEARSIIYTKELAERVMALAQSDITGICHIPASECIPRVELANYLLNQWDIRRRFKTETREQQPAPHLGKIELISERNGKYFAPLSPVILSDSVVTRQS